VKVLYDPAAERAVLGSILAEPSCLYRVIAELRPEDFYLAIHQRIYAAMLFLAEAGTAIDLTVLGAGLTDQGDIMSLAALADGMADFLHVENYAAIVRKFAVLRGVLDAAGGAIKAANAAGADPAAVLDALDAGVTALAGRSRHGGFHDGAVLRETITRELEETPRGTGPNAIYTGFRAVDELLVGMRPGNLCYLAGRTGMGKTALAVAIAMNLSKVRKRVGFMSLEMSAKELVLRMICVSCGINLQAALKHNLSTDEMAALGIEDTTKEFPVMIDHTPSMTALDVRGKCRRLKMEQGLDVIIVDHVHLMRSVRARQNRNDELGEISRGLKLTAKELNCPVIAVAQLNRDVEHKDRKSKRPKMSDLRESGNLEQDADLIILLYRQDYYEQDRSKHDGNAEIIIAKQRQGPTGIATLKFYKNMTKFSDY